MPTVITLCIVVWAVVICLLAYALGSVSEDKTGSDEDPEVDFPDVYAGPYGMIYLIRGRSRK